MSARRSPRRPESAKPLQKPKISRKEEELTKENQRLKVTIDYMQDENTKLKEKLEKIADRLINNVDKSEYNFKVYKSLSDISVEEFTAMISDITSKKEKKGEHYLESRIEEVETRLTQMSGEFAKLIQLKMRLENGLEDIENCYCIETTRQKARSLKTHSANTQIFIQPPKYEDQNKTKLTLLEEILSEETVTEDENPLVISPSTNRLPQSVTMNLEPILMPRKFVKLPADTHVKDILPELKQLIIQTLSLQKGNGSDWRMFAERIGLSETLINQWKLMKLNQPMRNVLNVWSNSPGATVRLLHRHLVSPQLKSVMLAKRVTEYYNVD
ncbi:hypothetical protein LOTGIDRAFT_233305 [Lottia gigantea]|uniref:Death domain-containing protein n=1 Tax=Lottia gigantea TaxID=225164 RepID=V4AAD9_LOTGI|nr:hypothetical protein LOTGIDRAFT_233305 [Lottia gigantea]ESO92040.1 hypothetical protein LOTGIDRAFT_233305 [Lottia gigantea]